MMSPYQLFFLCCVLSVTVPVQGQFGNEGSEFCIGFLKKHTSYNAHVLVGSTSSSPVDFTIQYSNDQSSNEQTTLNSPYKVNLELFLNDDMNKAICFTTTGNNTSTGGLVILPYLLHSSPPAGGSASYLALPYQELVTDQCEYYTLSTSSYSDQYYSGFILVGLRDNTTITIYPSIPLNITQNTTSTDYITVQPDHNHTVILHRRQTLYIGKDGGADVTGTRIVSDKPLTVISGHEAGSVPSNGTIEPMAQQIPPTQLWGDMFMIVPMKGHSDGQIIKILSSVDYTEIFYNCHQSSNTALLQTAGSVLQFYVSNDTYCYIEANNSVLVGQFPYSSHGNTDGVTTMILVPSIDQYYNNVTFWTLNTTNNYISITVPVEDYDHNNIMYDGKSIPEECTWSPVYDNSNNLVGYGCRLSVSKGHHTVSNSNGLLSVLVYGFGIGHAYGYPASLHFTPSKVLGIYFSSNEYTIQETEGNITIIFNRVTHLTSEDHYQLNITAADGRINSAGRLTPISQYVIFSPMESSVSVPIIINDNDITEDNEYYTVQLCRITDPLRDTCIQAGIRVIDDDVTAVIGITECGGHFSDPGMITWSFTINITGDRTLPPGVDCNITTYIGNNPPIPSIVTECPNTSLSILQQLPSNGSRHETITSTLFVNGTDIMVDPDNRTCYQNIFIIPTITTSISSSSMATTSTISIPTPSEVTSSTIYTSSSSAVPVVPSVSSSSHTVAITLGTVLPLLTLVTVTAIIIAVCTCYRTRRKSRRTGSFSATDPPEVQNDDDEHANLITMISNPYQKYDVSSV